MREIILSERSEDGQQADTRADPKQNGGDGQSTKTEGAIFDRETMKAVKLIRV